MFGNISVGVRGMTTALPKKIIRASTIKREGRVNTIRTNHMFSPSFNAQPPAGQHTVRDNAAVAKLPGLDPSGICKNERGWAGSQGAGDRPLSPLSSTYSLVLAAQVEQAHHIDGAGLGF